MMMDFLKSEKPPLVDKIVKKIVPKEQYWINWIKDVINLKNLH